MHYILIAYRDGDFKKHHYPVAVKPNLTSAMDFAESHCTFRGGKYAVVVFAMNQLAKPDDIDLGKEVYRAKSRQCLETEKARNE